MAGPANAYGQINPQIVDPYNIETPLAQMAADPQKQGVALPLLALYRSDRGLQGSYAAQEMADQHKFALQKLLTDQQKAAGELINAGGQHGTLGVLATNPMTAGILQGADQNQLWGRQDLSNRTMEGNIVKDVGQGSQALTESGNPMVPGAVNKLLAGPYTTPMDPLKIRTAQIAAAAKAAGESGPHFSMSTGNPADATTVNITAKNLPALQSGYQDYLRSTGQTPTGAPATTSSAAPTNNPQTTSATGRTPPPVKAAPDAAIKRVNDMVNQTLRSGTPQEKAFVAGIQQHYVGGQPDIKIAPNGAPQVKGPGGVYYNFQ